MASIMTVLLSAFRFKGVWATHYGKGKVFLKSAVTNKLFHITVATVLPETQMFDVLTGTAHFNKEALYLIKRCSMIHPYSIQNSN